MKKVQFRVAKCTQNQAGTWVWTLKRSEEVIVFGLPKVVNRTYYIGGMSGEVAADTVIEESMERFTIGTYPYALVTDAAGDKTPMDIKDAEAQGLEYETVVAKWLHIKVD